jgi:dipeptidyl aminopeptidase/acylaminoacyl peptidase
MIRICGRIGIALAFGLLSAENQGWTAEPTFSRKEDVIYGRKYGFDYRELDNQSKLWVPITDPKRLEEITRQISPVYHVTSDDPPTFIIHGDKDTLVPLQQSELIVDKLKKAGVDARLVIKKGAGHGWLGLNQDETQIVDWFDKCLAK